MQCWTQIIIFLNFLYCWWRLLIQAHNLLMEKRFVLIQLSKLIKEGLIVYVLHFLLGSQRNQLSECKIGNLNGYLCGALLKNCPFDLSAGQTVDEACFAILLKHKMVPWGHLVVKNEGSLKVSDSSFQDHVGFKIQVRTIPTVQPKVHYMDKMLNQKDLAQNGKLFVNRGKINHKIIIIKNRNMQDPWQCPHFVFTFLQWQNPIGRILGEWAKLYRNSCTFQILIQFIPG